MNEACLIITTGGTIDKIYYDALSDYSVGESEVPRLLAHGHVSIQWEVVSLMRKDSLELTDADRRLIRRTVENTEYRRILITHGTDTMAVTGQFLRGISDKTIVLTGALLPARFRDNDAIFNIGFALAAAQTLVGGVYICMNGRIFTPDNVRKNRESNRFEEIT